jgi:hypothetical protein
MENNDEPLLRASVAVPPSSRMQTIGSRIKLTTIFRSKKYRSARRWQEAGETSSGCSHFNFRLPTPSFFDPGDSHRLTTCSIGSDSCRPPPFSSSWWMRKKKANRIDSSSIFFQSTIHSARPNEFSRTTVGQRGKKNQIGGSTSSAIC